MAALVVRWLPARLVAAAASAAPCHTLQRWAPGSPSVVRTLRPLTPLPQPPSVVHTVPTLHAHAIVRWAHTFIGAGAVDITPASIPRAKVETNFSRSGGAGGQNVNKVNTKAEIRFHVPSADWLDDHTKQRLMLMNAGAVTKDGDIIITSQRHRT
jgi:hypothetical protein